ncbi:PREDICTED: RNA pseudouridylate synthase domain-containing protein 4-like [Dinoponera quadriceps]|uniref:RNA pseudouridylate synthase domain-containing protein 4-like n=1 Tax=Dinoponera quadriceps TaxID=609295 RepID=A0A6P3XVF7_DINQU|nr:PREDICTED: RNA pseudouridylate synthase domain-containing protein 4-like [Dinoponera quadriceps]
MKNTKTVFKIMQSNGFAMAYRTCFRKYCTTDEIYTLSKKKVAHPYQGIHPWKSKDELAKYLLKNIIYNAGGIVVINKPYGIPVTDTFTNDKNLPSMQSHKIANASNYSIESVLPYITKELDVPALIPCSGAEKYMSGTYVFAINDDVVKQVMKAKLRATHFNKFTKYWGITIRLPHEIKGSYRLAMILKKSEYGVKKPIFMTHWSKNEEKRGDVKIMNVKYKLLSNSTNNLSSLIEIESSARKWQCIRLFASIMLYSPILGDNYHGSRVQEIMGTWMKVDPFAESSWDLPKINRQLLELLELSPRQQEIIPVHLHMRSMNLFSFGKEKKNIVLEAPLIHPFDWTCKQLMFKNIPCEADHSESTENEVKINSM